jgi:hypothetical protein
MDKQTPGPVTRGEIPESLDYLSPESRRVFLPSSHMEQRVYYTISSCHSSLFSIYLFLFLHILPEPEFFVKGSLTRDFRLQVFFLKSVSPGPLSIPLGTFRMFSKIRRDFREWTLISGVNDMAKKEKNFEIKFLNLFCSELSLVHFTPTD